jgi:hypothetical protein
MTQHIVMDRMSMQRLSPPRVATNIPRHARAVNVGCSENCWSRSRRPCSPIGNQNSRPMALAARISLRIQISRRLLYATASSDVLYQQQTSLYVFYSDRCSNRTMRNKWLPTTHANGRASLGRSGFAKGFFRVNPTCEKVLF